MKKIKSILLAFIIALTVLVPSTASVVSAHSFTCSTADELAITGYTGEAQTGTALWRICIDVKYWPNVGDQSRENTFTMDTGVTKSVSVVGGGLPTSQKSFAVAFKYQFGNLEYNPPGSPASVPHLPDWRFIFDVKEGTHYHIDLLNKTLKVLEITRWS